VCLNPSLNLQCTPMFFTTKMLLNWQRPIHSKCCIVAWNTLLRHYWPLYRVNMVFPVTADHDRRGTQEYQEAKKVM
jgi:hypothetical protein